MAYRKMWCQSNNCKNVSDKIDLEDSETVELISKGWTQLKGRWICTNCTAHNKFHPIILKNKPSRRSITTATTRFRKCNKCSYIAYSEFSNIEDDLLKDGWKNSGKNIWHCPKCINPNLFPKEMVNDVPNPTRPV